MPNPRPIFSTLNIEKTSIYTSVSMVKLKAVIHGETKCNVHFQNKPTSMYKLPPSGQNK